MKRHLLFTAIVTLVFSGSVCAADGSYGDGNARVRLVAGGEKPDSGLPTALGVHFDIKPGWHVYWRNPGGAGLATDIQWRLPEGVEASDLRWPLPIGFVQSGDIPGYGYEGSVVLASELRPAQSLKGNAIVGASVSWLACKDVCVLGSAELESKWVDVPVDLSFEGWTESLPVAFEPSSLPFSVKVMGSLSLGSIQMWLQWQKPPTTVEWFPDAPEGLEVDEITIQTRGGLTRIDAAVRRLAGSSTTSNNFDSLVVVTDDQQFRRGWQLAVEIPKDSN